MRYAMNGHRYILEKGSKKYICSYCRKKTLVRYVDNETGEYLPEQYGRCDRESKCAYHLNPYIDGYAVRNNKSVSVSPVSEIMHRSKSILSNRHQESVKGFIPYKVLKSLLNGYVENDFIQNLLSKIPFPFGSKDIEKLLSLYYIGTIKKGYRKGAAAIPFIDRDNNIRAIQVKQFDDNSHTSGTDFYHSMLEKHYQKNNKQLPEWLSEYLKAEKKVSCLFGEHLLNKYTTNTIALVEAPKTALIGTLYFGYPDNPNNMLWLAVYNKSSFSKEKVEVLKDRRVFVFPDLSANGDTFKEWENKAKKFEKDIPGTQFVLFELLEKAAPHTDKKNGLDLADYLIQLDWRAFRSESNQPQVCEMELAEIEKYNRRVV